MPSPMILSPVSRADAALDSPMSIECEHPLSVAILGGDLQSVESIICHGARQEVNQYILYQACLQGIDMVKILLSSPEIRFNFNVLGAHGDSIFRRVARTSSNCFRTGKAAIGEALLYNGADPFGQDSFGETALHVLAGMRSEEDCRLLRIILRGVEPARIDERNQFGDTALMIAIISHNPEATRALLEWGADPKVTSESFGTASQYAAEQHNLEMLAILMEFGYCQKP